MRNEKRIIFLGSPLPEEMLERRTMSYNVADNIAQNVMIRGLHRHYGEDLVVISELSEKAPAELDLGNGIKALPISSNGANRVLYYLSLLVNYTRKLDAVLKEQNDTHKTVVITRGSYIFIALPVILARLKYRVKWVPFIVTTVEVPEYRFPFNLISMMSRWTSKKVDGAIGYVANTAKDYMPGKPFLEIAYSIDDKKIQLYREHQVDRGSKFTIAYTGSLSNTYNFRYVIDAIRASGTRFHWVFAGTGFYAEEIEGLAASEKYDVEYLGSINNFEAIKLQKLSHLLLCPRGGNPSSAAQYYSKYAASGKLTEYLCSGTPILASDVQSTSDAIRLFITLEKRQTAEQFVRDIEEIERDYAYRLKLAHEGRDYALEHFNSGYQNLKVYEFLEAL